jgi:hypothetical protein
MTVTIVLVLMIRGHGDKETPIMGSDSNAISGGIVYAFSHQLIK